MQCDEFGARLQDVMDRRVPPEQDGELQRHATVCFGCREQLSAAGRLLDGLELFDPPELPTDFADRVVADVTVSRRSHLSLRWALSTIAIAATLLLVVLPGGWYLLHFPNRPVATRQSFDPQRQMARTDTTNSGIIDSEFSSSDDGWWVLPRESLVGLYPEETRERHRQQVNEIARDLRPIASPFNAAAAAFRKALPVRRNTGKTRPRASTGRMNAARYLGIS